MGSLQNTLVLSKNSFVDLVFCGHIFFSFENILITDDILLVALELNRKFLTLYYKVDIWKTIPIFSYHTFLIFIGYSPLMLHNVSSMCFELGKWDWNS